MLLDVGWLDDLLGVQRRGWGHEQQAAEMASRATILANAERDRQRAERLAAADEAAVVRWRWLDGRWLRWSELDAADVAAVPPESLLAFAGTGLADGQHVWFVDEEWTLADPAADPAPSRPGGPSTPVPRPSPGSVPAAATTSDAPSPAVSAASPAPAAVSIPPPPPPPPTADPASEEEAASFEEQLAAWRRRR
jgi:hypothetical protein